MAKPFRECPYCGAHLDSGESCDCAGARRETKKMHTQAKDSEKRRVK